MLGWFRKAADDDRAFGANRSGKWPAVRAAFLRKNPACIACGRTAKLEVHHIQPFHLRPDLELIESNLCALCDTPCHLVHGHFLNWSASNPEVIEQCKNYLDGLRRSRSRVA